MIRALRLTVYLWPLVALLVSAPAVAAPQPAPPPTTPPAKRTAPPRRTAPQGPWHRGVSEANKKKALALYEVGNALFAKRQRIRALRVYRRAVKLWDHPGIRYNMAKCLVELKQYLAAYRSLQLALRYGAAPLDPPRLYKEGRWLKAMLERLLSRLRIVCMQPGVRVTLNGKLLFMGPGARTQLVDPANRQVVVAEKPRHITVTRTVAPVPGRSAVVRLQLMPIKKTVVYKRRWARWLPWTVLAVGVVVAGISVPFLKQAVDAFAQYDEDYKSWCKEPQGCYLSDRPNELLELDKKGDKNRFVGALLLGIGSAAIAAGVTLVILNLPRAVKPERPPSPSPRVDLRPFIGPRGAGLGLTLRY